MYDTQSCGGRTGTSGHTRYGQGSGRGAPRVCPGAGRSRPSRACGSVTQVAGPASRWAGRQGAPLGANLDGRTDGRGSLGGPLGGGWSEGPRPAGVREARGGLGAANACGAWGAEGGEGRGRRVRVGGHPGGRQSRGAELLPHLTRVPPGVNPSSSSRVHTARPAHTFSFHSVSRAGSRASVSLGANKG